MIKYALRCDKQHNWEAWFASISGYDDQQARGLVECPFCGTTSVEKAPMAPAIVSSIKAARHSESAAQTSKTAPVPDPGIATSNLPSLTLPEPIQAMLAEFKQHIEATHDYVGDTFAREARAMHEGDTQERPIYGQATTSEIRDLIEDDIPIAPLPTLASPKGIKGVH
jgi:hypothetical protein